MNYEELLVAYRNEQESNKKLRSLCDMLIYHLSQYEDTDRYDSILMKADNEAPNLSGENPHADPTALI